MGQKSFKCLLLVLVFALTACVSSARKDDKKEASLHLKLGTAHLSKGNYPMALKELLMAKKLDPTNPVTFNNLGLAYLVRAKYSDAEQNIKTAIELEPTYTEARNNLGRVYIHKGQFKEAIHILKIATNDLTYPHPDKSQSNLGLAYFKNKQYDLAERHLKNSLKIRREDCFTQSYYGRTLLAQNKLDLAIQTFKGAIAPCDKVSFQEPRYYSALSYLEKGESRQALAQLQEILSMSPESDISQKASETISLIKRNSNK